MCSGFSTMRRIYLINEDITRAKTFYLVYLSFLLSSCSLWFFFRGTTGAKVTGLWQCWCHSASRLSQCWQHTLWKLPANGCLSTAETCQPMSAQAKNLPTNDCWTLYLANYACQITGCSFFLLNWELMDFREFWMDGEFPAQFQGEKKKVLHVVPLSVSSD